MAGVPDGLCRGKEVFLVPGQTWQASLTPSEASETFSGVFWSFRGLGNVQRRVLMLSEPSETFSGVFWSFPSPRKRSAARFDTFRGLGNVQRRVLMLSEPSETFSGAF